MLETLLDQLPAVLLGVGLILIAMEAFSPGAHLIVIGVGFAGAGFVGMVYEPASDILALALLTLFFGGVATYVYRTFDFYGGKGIDQTSSSDSLAAETGFVVEEVTPRGGTVKLDSGGFDPHFTAQSTGATIEEGERVIVLDPGGGNVLTVEPLSSIEEEDVTTGDDDST